MKTLSESLNQIYSTKWTYTNNFHIVINFPATLSTFIGWDDNHEISTNLVKINFPSFDTQHLENFIADRYIFSDGAPNPYQFTMTFRDQDSLKYYRTFLLAKTAQQKMYFENYKFSITFTKDSDYAEDGDMIIYRFDDCIIENVSPIEFDNSQEAQIATFDVSVKCVTPLFNTADIGTKK